MFVDVVVCVGSLGPASSNAIVTSVVLDVVSALGVKLSLVHSKIRLGHADSA